MREGKVLARRLRGLGDCMEALILSNPFSSMVHCCWVYSFLVILGLVVSVWCLGQILAISATGLDQHLTSQAPVTGPGSFEARVRNSTMPKPCSSIVETDAVDSAQVEECLAWCRRSLGSAMGLPYAFSPLHWRYLRKTSKDVETSFKMCWKVETAAWALGWCPSAWQMYLIAGAYGSISGIMFLCFLRKNSEETDSEESGSESSSFRLSGAPDDEDFREGSPFYESRRHRPPLCCFGISSDYEGAICQLRLASFFMIFEPALDILSIIMFLRRGQPIYAAVVSAAVILSCILERDPFQIRGVAAMADSLGRGYATIDLFAFRVHELVESSGTAIVQCYAALRMHMRCTSLSAVLTLLGSAGISLALSMPEACKALRVIMHEHVPWVHSDYYYQERIKKQTTPLQRYWPSVLCMAIAEAALILGSHNEGQFSDPWSVIAGMSSPSDLWLSALLLLFFRVAVMAGLLLAICGCLAGCWLLALGATVLDDCGG